MAIAPPPKKVKGGVPKKKPQKDEVEEEEEEAAIASPPKKAKPSPKPKDLRQTRVSSPPLPPPSLQTPLLPGWKTAKDGQGVDYYCTTTSRATLFNTRSRRSAHRLSHRRHCRHCSCRSHNRSHSLSRSHCSRRSHNCSRSHSRSPCSRRSHNRSRSCSRSPWPFGSSKSWIVRRICVPCSPKCPQGARRQSLRGSLQCWRHTSMDSDTVAQLEWYGKVV